MPKKVRSKGYRHSRNANKQYMQNHRSHSTEENNNNNNNSSDDYSCRETGDQRIQKQLHSVNPVDVPATAYSPEHLIQMIGNSNTEIPDDVIVAAVNLMEAHNQSALICIGPYTPALLQLISNGVYMQQRPYIPPHKNVINIHPLKNHWVTSYYNATDQQLFVYDSLMSSSHLQQVQFQLQHMFGKEKSASLQYPRVTQQQTEPICGVMAIAFAFSCFLGHNPALLHYDITAVRLHLRHCIANACVEIFPLKTIPIQQNPKVTFNDCSRRNNMHGGINAQGSTASQRNSPLRNHFNKQTTANNNVFKSNFLNAYNIPKLLNASSKQPQGFEESQLKTNSTKSSKNVSVKNFEQQPLYMQYNIKQIHANSQQSETEKQRGDASKRTKKFKTEGIHNKKYNEHCEDTTQQSHHKFKATKRETLKRRQKRQQLHYKLQEAERETQKRKEKRQQSHYRLQEAKRETQKRQEKRQQSHYRLQEAKRETQKRQEKRQQSHYRLQEAKRETQKRREKRQQPSYRLKECKRETQKRQEQRQQLHYRLQETDQETQKRREKRQQPSYRLKECKRETQKRKKKRRQLHYRRLETDRETQKRQEKRQQPQYRSQETQRETPNRKRKRKNQQYKAKQQSRESAHRKKKRYESLPDCVDTLILNYHKKISEGPIFVCTSCSQILYKHSVNKMSHTLLQSQDTKVQQIIQQCPIVPSIKNEVWICQTCKSYISKGKIPPMSVMNNMKFQPQGILQDLNPLELTLLAIRLPFLKIHEAPRGKQKIIHGNMVLVPADIDSTVKQLPRLASDTATIKATLKRRLRYKHHVYSLNIRPDKVRDAAKYLSTTPLYKEYISFNDQWTFDTAVLEVDNCNIIQNCQNRSTPDAVLQDSNQSAHTHSDSLQDSGSNTVNEITHHDRNLQSYMQREPQPEIDTSKTDDLPKKDSSNDDDNWSELDEDEIMCGEADTLLTTQDFIEPGERDILYNFAPGENHIPVSVFIDKDCEELAFPGIFCGHRRPSHKDRPVKVTYGEIVKSELRNSDRRAASNVENLFFKTKKLQMKTLIDQTQLALRKLKTKDHTLTAKDVKGSAIKELIHHDKAYKFLSSIRGSPPYFEKVSKDLFALIRQLGPATFFLTLSAAETRWIHLLRILGQVVDKIQYTDEELQQMTWAEKCRLIQSDPITCARHFDYAVSKFISDILLSKCHPLAEVQDYFFRVEYQQRGSPHIHMMIWCKSAPQYGKDSETDICEFIDNYITCRAPDESDPETELINLQTHRHSHTCRKKRLKICRFGYPKPPLPKTMILEPLSPPEFSQKDIAFYKKKYLLIHENLHNIEAIEQLNYRDFLSHLNLSEEQYILAIRASINRPTIFLKRTLTETRVNNYNYIILQTWRANIDIQFVLDVYACATYVAAYVTKSHRGMSELLRKASQEVRNGNLTVKEQVKNVGNKFLNAVEISAQEAAYICLQLPMRRSSRKTVFINTSPPEQRVTLLKPQSLLQSMDDNDEDIECSNLITRYAARPKSMETVTLAEFAAHYERIPDNRSPNRRTFPKKSLHDLLPEPVDVENDDEETTSAQTSVTAALPETDETQYRRRKQANILRYVHFNPNKDLENFYREQIMLFHPWRDENTLKHHHDTYSDCYKEVEEQIQSHKKQYEPFAEAVDLAEKILQERNDQDDIWDMLAPMTQHEDAQDLAHKTKPTPTGIEDYDIAFDLGLQTSNTEQDLHDYHEMADEPYRDHMRLLNKQQLQFVYDTIHKIKTSAEPIFRFLSGGAGVGKSFVTKALYQTALKYLNKQEGESFKTRKLLLLAPTGKAAYHIQGTTIHSGLKIAANQKLQHKPLPCSTLNTLRNEIANVKLIFIDEISMVGFRMLNCIHQRLMEVMQNAKPFGGVSIIAVGDLFQLKPVMDNYLFMQPNTDYLPLAPNLWQELFSMVELKEILRQADNKPFAEMLNRMREGNQTMADIVTLKDHVIQPDAHNYPHKATHLFTTNNAVNSFNTQAILRSNQPTTIIKAKDTVVGSTPPAMKQKILQNFKANSQVKQLLNVLEVCEGIPYDLTVNLDTSDGLINGASCTVMKIDVPSSETYACGILWVEFIDGEIGSLLRNESKRLYTRSINKHWTPLGPIVKQYAAGHKVRHKYRDSNFLCVPHMQKLFTELKVTPYKQLS